MKIDETLRELEGVAEKKNIKVTYDHGYTVAGTVNNVPRSIRMVALMIASRLVVQGVAQQETVDGQIKDLTDRKTNLEAQLQAIQASNQGTAPPCTFIQLDKFKDDLGKFMMNLQFQKELEVYVKSLKAKAVIDRSLTAAQ